MSVTWWEGAADAEAEAEHWRTGWRDPATWDDDPDPSEYLDEVDRG